MRKLKLFFACLLMAVLSIGQVWGATVEVISTLNYSTSTAVDEQVTVVENVLYFTGAKNDATTAPTFNVGTSATDLRLYKLATNGSTYSTFTFSVADGYKLDGIEFKKNSTTASTLSNIAAGTGTLSGNSWTPTLNSTTTSVTFTYSGTGTFKQQIYIINVTYSSTGSSTTPTVNVSPASWDFGNVAESESASKTFEVSGSNLTAGQNLTLTAPTGYTVSPTSITVSSATLGATNVTVSKDKNTIGANNGNLSITGGGLTSPKTVGLTMNIIADPTFAELPFSFTKGRDDIENTDGMEQSGLGTDYTSGNPTANLKFDHTGDYIIIRFTEEPDKLTYDIQGNGFSGGTFKVQTSADGETYTDLTTYTELGASSSKETSLGSTVRFVKFIYANKSSGNVGLGKIGISKAAAPAAVATPTISGDNQFMTSTSVTMSCETDGANIYYTTKESAKDDKATDGDWKAYDNPTFTSTTTVWAAAKKGDDWSNIASATFTKLPHYDNIQAMYTAADAETDVYVTFGNWVVSGVSTNGKNVYVTDNTNGFIIYNNNGGLENHFAVGKVLSGTAKCKMLKFNGALELKELNSETAGLNIATGGTISENQTALASLSGVNTGSLISISDACTNPSGSIFKVGDFQLYNSLYAFANPTAGSNYNVTGIFVQYGETKEICPRSAADIVEQQEKQNANTQWEAASKTVRVGDATTGWWSTASDGAKSFISTNEAVATINATGEITLVAPGTTTLKFSTAASDTYFAGPEVSMVLTVKAALPTGGEEFTWVAKDQGYENAQNVTTASETPIAIAFAKGEGSNDPKFYGDGSASDAVRVYKNNTITIGTAANDKLMAEITFNFGPSDNSLSGNGLVVDGTTGTWSGLAKELTFINNTSGSDKAYIRSINVVYAPGTVTELEIADVAMKISETHTIVPTKHNPNSAPIEYTIATEDQAYATIENGVITPHALTTDPITVTARIAQGSNYTAAETTFTITVAAKTIPALSFPQASYDANLGESFEAPALTNPEGVTVLYSSDNAAVSVDENTGEITLNTEGTAVITATSVETTDYAVNTASYTLNVTDPYKDVLTATGIGQSGYGTWTNKTFTTETKYDGYSTTGTGANGGAIQMNTTNPGGIVNISTIGYLKALSATAHSGNAKSLNIYAKNTPYASSADLYDNDKRGTLIGTIAADGGEIDFEDGFAYSDNYKYIGIKANGGAVYYDEIVIKWTPATINKYTVTYEAGEASGDDVVINNVEEGTPITLAAADTYSKEGYTFMGWNDGTQTYAAGASYTVNDDVTFTAQWAQNFTVTYKAGEATGDDVVRTVPAGAYNLESCSFVYANHAFDGWQNGANKYNAGAEVTISENMEFVAQWVEAMAPITVTFTAGTDKSSSLSIYKNGIKIAVSSGTLNNDDDYRCYASNHMTVSSELGNITQIVITSTSQKPANAFSIEGDNGNYAYESLVGTWTGSSASIQLNASSQVRMTEIQVTYIPNAYQRNVTAGNFGTLCLPFDGTIEGAELLEFVDKDADNVYLGNSDATVHAGKPYIFRATADQIKVSFTGNNFVAADNHNGLYGTYVRMENEELNGTCLISNNQYYNIDTDNCSLNAYRAYFKLNEVPGNGSNSARRRYAIGNGAPQVATGVDTLNASETPVKMIIDGQLYILRGEKMYDATGKLVK